MRVWEQKTLTIDEVWKILRYKESANLKARKRKLDALAIPYVKRGTDRLYEADAFEDWWVSQRRYPQPAPVTFASQLG